MSTLIDILKVVISWEGVSLVVLFLLLTPIKALIQRLIDGDDGEARVGPIEVKLGKVVENGEKAVSDLHRINYIMAESRRLELEITVGMSKVYESLGFSVMSSLQSDEMQKHISELRFITKNTVNKQKQSAA